jgi:type I restriction-modification system DNA methylase subunit
MTGKAEALNKIKGLVDKYKKIEHEGRLHEYKEVRTLDEFIKPLFAALGWDMQNTNAPDEVVPEDVVSHGRVDLAFRLNHIPVLFVEAKSLAVGVEDIKSVCQAIEYSWHKGVTWAVLTDFRNLQIFNAELPPKDIYQNRFKDFSCLDFEARFEKLWLLSRESFTKRLLDTEAEDSFKKAKRKPVDAKLFEDMLGWRKRLEKEFSKKNGSLSREDVDEGVQRILDRLIFIRTAADRMIEPNTFTEWLNSDTVSWKNLNSLFRNFDDGYNSKLFAFHACENWKADDSILKTILEEMKETPDGYRYDFNLIPSDVLGGMYEQYLSTIHQKATKKKEPSKQRKQGIYYTPKYIVDFIVRETVGKVLGETKQKDVKHLKILDPACGSGSFLVSAFDKVISAQKQGLFTKQQALKENIFGLDIDPQAVEIAQLNLLLKLLFGRERLPNMQHNIVPANSLMMDINEKYDAIIGNPPYIKEYTNRTTFDGLHSSPYYQGKMDIWTLFACRAIDQLKDGGYFSFIAPNNWITNFGASKFRDKILSEGELEKFVDFGDYKVFRDRTTGKDVGIQTMIFVFKKKKPRASYPVVYAKVLDKALSELEVSEWLTSGFQNRTEQNRNL